MSNIALITGASSGIGREFARIHAHKGGDLVLVARRENELNKLKVELEDKYSIKILVISCDLSTIDSANKIFEKTQSENLQIDILINNAGFGGHGKFYERDLIKDQNMMQVNMVTLVNLTHLYLKEMIKRKSGKILHVASTAGFIPGPLQATYFATKAFVNSFSQSLAKELEGTGVTSTVLCPGAVTTEFMKVGDLEGLSIWKLAKSPASVAACGYKAMERGEILKFNEFLLNFLINWIVPFIPRKLLLNISYKSMLK